MFRELGRRFPVAAAAASCSRRVLPVGRAPPPGPMGRGLLTGDLVPGCLRLPSTRKILCFWASLAGQLLGLQSFSATARVQSPVGSGGPASRGVPARSAASCGPDLWRAAQPRTLSPGVSCVASAVSVPSSAFTSGHFCPDVCACPESCSASSICRFVSSTKSADVVSHYFFEPLPSAHSPQTLTRPPLLSSLPCPQSRSPTLL